MTAVASPPSFQQNSRTAWGSSVNTMQADEVARMFMPRKSAQRTNSSSSVSSIASSSSASSTSSNSTITQSAPQSNGIPMSTGESSWGTGGPRKKPQRTGPWPTTKSEAISGVSTTRPQSILATNGASAATSMTSINQPPPVVPSQSLQSPAQQSNGTGSGPQAVGPGNPVLYLLSMNGTFERKSISVPYYPDSLRIGRQTNAKTLPTPANGFFDSKVLSRQHAEIYADRQGKIWIRDVKSSNGTFVNGSRLSPENRDSDPHELSTQDHLELGIDIVSEDQKTVVHHKVAAKVEHAGFLGPTNNVMEMNFGDLDPANGAMMVPSQGIMRNRAGSQGSVASNGRLGPPSSVAGSQMSIMGQQRPMNFWLTPVTTEGIVKRLTHEMKQARLQASDLGRAEQFFGTLLSKENVKEAEKPAILDQQKATQVNGGGSVALRGDSKTRFSDPPAPPPQQPLPEKPDGVRSHNFESSSPTSLKRSNTERPKSVTSGSPIRPEPTSQILNLVESLASAKKELEVQGARMRDLEELLRKEREAREAAEEVAKRLGVQSSESKMNGHAKGGSILEDAFEPPIDLLAGKENDEPVIADTKAVDESRLLLEKHIEMMAIEMQQMKEHMESYKVRAEIAESEARDTRATLAQMVEKIRTESSKGGRSPASHDTEDGSSGILSPGSLFEKAGPGSRRPAISPKDIETERPTSGTLTRPPGGHDPVLYHAAPYVSMLGVILIGMAAMTYLNGWQVSPPKPNGS